MSLASGVRAIVQSWGSLSISQRQFLTTYQLEPQQMLPGFASPKISWLIRHVCAVGPKRRQSGQIEIQRGF